MNDRMVSIPEKHALTLLAFARGQKVHDDGARAALQQGINALPPVMDEPTAPGSVVMTDEGPAESLVSVTPPKRWRVIGERWGGFDAWSDLTNPRPLTPAERRDLGMPALLPDGYVAVKRVGFLVGSTWLGLARTAELRGDFHLSALCSAYNLALALEVEGQA